MSWIEKRGDSFHLSFRVGQRKFKKSLKTESQREAEEIATRVDRRLRL